MDSPVQIRRTAMSVVLTLGALSGGDVGREVLAVWFLGEWVGKETVRAVMRGVVGMVGEEKMVEVGWNVRGLVEILREEKAHDVEQVLTDVVEIVQEEKAHDVEQVLKYVAEIVGEEKSVV